MGMGIKIEMIEAKPWPPEDGVVPPVELEWYKRYWPYLGLGGIGMGVGAAAVALAIKKRK